MYHQFHRDGLYCFKTSNDQIGTIIVKPRKMIYHVPIFGDQLGKKVQGRASCTVQVLPFQFTRWARTIWFSSTGQRMILTEKPFWLHWTRNHLSLLQRPKESRECSIVVSSDARETDLIGCCCYAHEQTQAADSPLGTARSEGEKRRQGKLSPRCRCEKSERGELREIFCFDDKLIVIETTNLPTSTFGDHWNSNSQTELITLTKE